MPVILVPSSLRRYTDQQSRVAVTGETVAGTLDNFVGQPSELRNHIFNAGNLRSFIVVCKNGQDIRLLDGLATPVAANDEIRILASIAGG